MCQFTWHIVITSSTAFHYSKSHINDNGSFESGSPAKGGMTF